MTDPSAEPPRPAGRRHGTRFGRMRTLLALGLVTVAVLAPLYVSGVWVPWSPWTVEATSVDWRTNSLDFGSLPGFTIHGGGHIVVSVPWVSPLHYCGQYGCTPRGVAWISIVARTPGFSVVDSNLPVSLAEIPRNLTTIYATVAAPWADYQGPLVLELEYGIA